MRSNPNNHTSPSAKTCSFAPWFIPWLLSANDLHQVNPITSYILNNQILCLPNYLLGIQTLHLLSYLLDRIPLTEVDCFIWVVGSPCKVVDVSHLNSLVPKALVQPVPDPVPLHARQQRK